MSVIGSNDTVDCAICGFDMSPDDDHAVIEVNHKRVEDRDRIDDYYLHTRCQQAVFAGWRSS